MSEQLALKIKNFLKDNMVGVIFILILAFFGFSVWTSSQNINNDINSLISFADESLPEIRTSFERISKRSSFDSHTQEQYDQVIADFQDLEKRLVYLSEKIPTESNDVLSDKLENNLRTFYFETRTNIVQRWIEMLKARKELVEDYNTAAKLKLVATTGSVADLQKVINSSKKVADFEKANLSLIQDLNDQKNRSQELEKDFARLSAIQGILNKTPEGGELSPQNRADIQTLYEKAGWPIETSIFPVIQAKNLETKEFASTVVTLRDMVIELRQKYQSNKAENNKK